MNPGPAISILSKESFSLMERISSFAISLGGFFSIPERDIAIGVARSPKDSRGGTSISIAGIVSMPRVLSESSIVLTISFFTELKFKQRLCSKSTEQTCIREISFVKILCKLKGTE